MSAWTWGSDIYGRLGHGTVDKNLSCPTEVKYFSNIQLKAVTCGSAHNIAIDVDGHCYTWGKCHFGQLGHGEENRDEHVPRLVSALSGVCIENVGAGDSHVLATTTSGQLYSWGVGYYGCLGHGDEKSLYVPKIIDALSGRFIVSVSGGANHSIVRDNEGNLFVWGRDNFGQLGQPLLTIPGLSKPIRVNQKLPIPFKKLANGETCQMMRACHNHTLILTSSGCIISLGCNDNGELGHPDDCSMIDPSLFIGSSGNIEQVKYISAGWKHCAALTVSGCLYTWGEGQDGKLGLGHLRNVKTPKRVFAPNSNPQFKQVSCSDSHTLAVDIENVLWACGSGHYGKLGLAVDVATELQPLQRATTGAITGIVCGTNHNIAFRLKD